MKAFLQSVVMVVLAAGTWQYVAAGDFYSGLGNIPPVVTVGEEKGVAEPQAPCDDNIRLQCNGCNDCDGCGCDDMSPAFVGAFGFDTFKGLPDAGLNDNFGGVAGLNSSVPLFGLAERGFGWQTGVTYGVYDFDGRYQYDTASAQQQIFVTTGFYRKARCDENLSFGIVYDWMVNNNFSYTAVDPTLGQWRGQAEWSLSECNAFGVRGALRDRVGRNAVTINDRRYTANTRGVSHGEFFWHHFFEESKADTFLWMGFTQSDRLNGDASLYDWLIGVSAEVPLSDRVTLYGSAQYVHPTCAAGEIASIESSYNVSMGFAYYFGGCARSRSIHGAHGPYMPVANNSNFITDQYYTLSPN